MRHAAATALLTVIATFAVAASADATPRGCGLGPAQVDQSLNGHLSGCVQVGNISAGRYVLTIEPLPTQPVPPRKGTPPPVQPRTPHEPAVKLSVSPGAGAPGTLVTVTGRLKRAVAHDGQPDICWDGCVEGLQYGDPPVHWTSGRVFRIRLRVPAAPWIQGAPLHVARLVSGTYRIGVNCILTKEGCALAHAEGSVAFRLRVTHQPGWCRTAATCAALSATSGKVLPGGYVRVHGEAPLVSISGSAKPYLYGLTVRRGSRTGPELSFPGHRLIHIGHAPLRVLAPPSFASIQHPAPATEVLGGLDAVGGDPADSGTVADCGQGTIVVVSAGTTSSFSTDKAASTIHQLGYASASSGTPSCVAVAPDGAAVVAAFPVEIAGAGGPPFYDVALVTFDRGQSWSALPTPHGSEPIGFGGFRDAGGDLEAVYAATEQPRSSVSGPFGTAGTVTFPTFDVARPLVERSDDGAVSWQSASACPASGPCLTLGPYGVGNCAMGVAAQDVLRSGDGGERFTVPRDVGGFQPCGEGTLERTAGGAELLVDGADTFPLLRSTDGGRTWDDISLPRPPGANHRDGQPVSPDGLTVLPDGGLLLSGGVDYRGGWELLEPGARAWCASAGPDHALQHTMQASQLTVIGDEIWWQTVTGTGGPGTSPPALQHVALSSVRCSA